MSSVRSVPVSRLDHRERPAYPLSEAARYLRLPVATLRDWTLGRHPDSSGHPKRSAPVVEPASRRPPALSFWNLIECHVLRALRTEHGVPLREVRVALSYAERELGIEHLLLHKDLQTSTGQLFLQIYGGLINLSASGQFAMEQVLKQHLSRVEWDAWHFPVRLFPFVLSEAPSGERPIAIDPAIAFGRPILVECGVTTAVIRERIDAGETPKAVAADYELTLKDIEQAILYERVA